MLKADQRYFEGRFHNHIEKAMAGRNLLPNKAPTASSPNPAISIGDGLADLKSADRWRTEAGELLPGAGEPLKAETVWSNDEGETFVRYSGVRQVDLDSETVTDLGMSLTFGFDSSGTLFHSMWEPVDTESIELARAEVDYWRSEGAIEDRSEAMKVSAQGTPGDSKGQTIGYTVPLKSSEADNATASHKRKLVRIPIATAQGATAC